MNYEKMMHVSFFTDTMEEMMDFYTNNLGGTVKVLTHYSIYKDRPDRPNQQKIALQTPDKIFNVYIELCEGQFVELFPKAEGQKEHNKWNESLGYSHFALTVKDIHEAVEELEQRGVKFLSRISFGPSHTYQIWMADPDDNRIELMQFTEDSFQVKGHFE